MKKNFWTPSGPTLPPNLGSSSADSPLKIWDVMPPPPPPMRFILSKKQKIDYFDHFRLNDPLKLGLLIKVLILNHFRSLVFFDFTHKKRVIS